VTSYQDFLASKAVRAPLRGLETVPDIGGDLFRYQREAVAFGLRTGSWGCYLATGLGKTRCELAWSAHAAEASNGYALILTPLAVARQIEAEGCALGHDVRVIREQADARPGISVCNYDRLDRIVPTAFGAVALDEAGILKAFTGATSRALRAAFAGHRWRMAATATPAPNDSTEIANQADFLGVMTRDEMLVRWFINDSGDTKSWRLKGHAIEPFYDWMASWSVMALHPRDLGDDVRGFDLPPMDVVRHRAAESALPVGDGMLFAADVSAASVHDVKRATKEARARIVADLVHAEPREPFVVWIDTDYEADAVRLALGDVAGGLVEVRGSMTIEAKEDAIAAFGDGTARVILAKPSGCGWGLNWQHCARMVFAGRSFSYEMWHQAVRRCWRFGQRRVVYVHLVVAEGEEQIGRVLDRKAGDHLRMHEAMVAAMKRAQGRDSARRVPYEPQHDGRLPAWLRGGAA
jgi:hypothetical protein